jgi:cytochrome b561
MAHLRNSDSRYGLVSIVLHWTAALAILAMLATAVGIMTAPDEEAEGARIQLHVWTGTSLYLVIAARIAWSWIERKPVVLSASPAERSLARVVHAALLVLIALQLVTGPLGVWSGGWPVAAFDLFEIPSPFAGPQSWHDAIGEVHELTGFAIAVLVGLHLAGALKHALIDRDDTLRRMLAVRRRGPDHADAASNEGAPEAGRS